MITGTVYAAPTRRTITVNKVVYHLPAGLKVQRGIRPAVPAVMEDVKVGDKVALLGPPLGSPHTLCIL